MKKILPILFLFLLLSVSIWAGEERFKTGYEAFLSKNYSQTITNFASQIPSKFQPLSDYILWALGKSRIETGSYEEGIKSLEELLKSEPFSLLTSVAKVNIGKALQLKGDLLQARDFLKKNLESLSKDTKAEALYYLGLAQLQLGEKAEAAFHFKTIYLEYPNSVWASQALSQLQNMSPPQQFSVQELMNRADRIFESKNYAEALKSYEGVLRKEDSTFKVLATLKKGECLYYLKRYHEAIPFLKSTQSNIPLEFARLTLLHLGMSEQKSGNGIQAIFTFEKTHKIYPQTAEGEEAFYQLGKIALENGDFQKAYVLFQQMAEIYAHGKFRDKGLWSAGWNAYRHLDWEQALQFFSLLEKGATDFPTRGKAFYWRGRVFENQKNRVQAKQEWVLAYQASPYSYYGFLALKQLQGSRELKALPEIPSEWKIIKGSAKTGSLSSEKKNEEAPWDLHFQKALALYKWNLGKISSPELQQTLEQNRDSQGALLRLLEATKKSEAFFIPVLWGQKYWEVFKPLFKDEKEAESYRVSFQFPFAYRSFVQRASHEFSVPAELIVGLMRQESGFQPWVVSSANAQGLMQMLPSTARIRAHKAGIPLGDLFDPEFNIRLGTAELKGLLDRFSGNWIYAIAGYNAGPNRSSQWVQQNGNLSPDEFIEEIPFSETNLYVKLVLRNYWTYKALY